MEIFEDVVLGPTVDLDDLVARQLEFGLFRGSQDGRPADWLVRAWFEPKLSPALRQRLAASIHRALSHLNLKIVAEAVAALDGCPQMQDSTALNSFAAADSEDLQDRLTTLFRQLRAQDSGDRGADLLRIIVQHATLPSVIRLSRNLALSKEFGRATLACLCRKDPDWVVANAPRITAKDVDPDGQRMGILVFCFRNDRLRLLELLRALVDGSPARLVELQAVLEENISDSEERAALIALC